MKQWLKHQAARALRAILPPEPVRPPAPLLSPDAVSDILKHANPEWQEFRQRCHEMEEAKQLMGAGPWLPAGGRSQLDRPGKFRETAFTNQSWTADIELMLSNVEWRREINLSWLEFSRWGIQQIIQISRLYYIKHPWIRRGVNLSAAYVFGQGVELSSPDPDANETLKRFRERNKASLGQIALTGQERSKSTDGNLFWALFADKESTGDVNVRVIDATEILDIVTNPDDATEEWFFRRVWTQRNFDQNSGQTKTETQERWYPALNYEPADKIPEINKITVEWKMPVYHRKCGGVFSWLFGCPRIFPALDDAREGRKFLNSWASVWSALRQIAVTITTKGGQQALEGIKSGMQTSVGPTSNLLDQNPPAVAGSIFASGPGTVLSAFKTSGASGDPKEICELRNMVACVLEVPPTWLGDMETSNLSTAKTLDRPTELGFTLKREEWQEDISVFGQYQLRIALGASGSTLKEAMNKRKVSVKDVRVCEAARVVRDGKWIYEAAKENKPDVLEVLVTFPAIREGDVVEQMNALVDSATLGNKGGQYVGIDAKVFVRQAYKILGIDGGDEIAEEQFPKATYDPDRTKQLLIDPIGKAQPSPGGAPEVDAKGETAPVNLQNKKESAIQQVLKRLEKAVKLYEAESDGVANGHR